MERLIADALAETGIDFERERKGLDFYLPKFDLYIEVKRFHSDRIAGQMARADNVIAAQGKEAVQFLAGLIKEPPATSSPTQQTPSAPAGNAPDALPS